MIGVVGSGGFWFLIPELDVSFVFLFELLIFVIFSISGSVGLEYVEIHHFVFLVVSAKLPSIVVTGLLIPPLLSTKTAVKVSIVLFVLAILLVFVVDMEPTH